MMIVTERSHSNVLFRYFLENPDEGPRVLITPQIRRSSFDSVDRIAILEEAEV